MTQAFNNTSASKIPKRPTLDAGNMNQTLPHYLNNASTINGTQSTMEKSVESFYLRRFPREIFVYLVISSLQYWWFLALEKKWPVRPRYNDVSYQQEEKFDDNEDREEKVVKKWIAQGRVKRASLNWCNTFLKWVLDLTIGRLWYHVVEHVMRETIKWRSLKLILSDLKSVSSPLHNRTRANCRIAPHLQLHRRLVSVSILPGGSHRIHCCSSTPQSRLLSWCGVSGDDLPLHARPSFRHLGNQDGVCADNDAQYNGKRWESAT